MTHQPPQLAAQGMIPAQPTQTLNADVTAHTAPTPPSSWLTPMCAVEPSQCVMVETTPTMNHRLGLVGFRQSDELMATRRTSFSGGAGDDVSSNSHVDSPFVMPLMEPTAAGEGCDHKLTPPHAHQSGSLTSVEGFHTSSSFSLNAIAEHDDETNLFISGLPVDVTDTDLYSIFRCCGPICLAEVVRDPKTLVSRGVGFVQFVETKDADAAITRMNGSVVRSQSGGSSFTVRARRATEDRRTGKSGGNPPPKARPCGTSPVDATNKIFIRHVPLMATTNRLADYFGAFGTVTGCTIHRDVSRKGQLERIQMNMAYVTFRKSEDALLASRREHVEVPLGENGERFAGPLLVKLAETLERRNARLAPSVTELDPPSSPPATVVDPTIAHQATPLSIHQAAGHMTIPRVSLSQPPPPFQPAPTVPYQHTQHPTTLVFQTPNAPPTTHTQPQFYSFQSTQQPSSSGGIFPVPAQLNMPQLPPSFAFAPPPMPFAPMPPFVHPSVAQPPMTQPPMTEVWLTSTMSGLQATPPLFHGGVTHQPYYSSAPFVSGGPTPQPLMMSVTQPPNAFPAQILPSPNNWYSYAAAPPH